MIRTKHVARIAALTLLSAASAAADPSKSDLDQADTLFKEGVAAMKSAQYEVACRKFEQSDKLDPAPGTLRRQAECEEKRGELVLAWKHITEATRRAGSDDVLKLAREQAALLDKRLPRLLISLPDGAPRTAVVRLDDDLVATGDLAQPIPVNPGKHVVTFQVPGRRPTRQVLDVKEGASERVRLELGKASGGAGDSGVDAPTAPGSDSSQRTVGYVVGAGGLLLAGVATYFAFDARSHYGAAKNSVDPENDKGDKSHTLALVTGVAGGLALVGGITLVLTSPAIGDVAIRISPSVTGAKGLTMGGTW
jgi:hypothetical protein